MYTTTTFDYELAARDTSVRTSTSTPRTVIAASQNMPLFYPLPSTHHHLVSRDFCFCLNDDDNDDDPFKAWKKFRFYYRSHLLPSRNEKDEHNFHQIDNDLMNM